MVYSQGAESSMPLPGGDGPSYAFDRQEPSARSVVDFEFNL
jgi:hypothetical protein